MNAAQTKSTAPTLISIILYTSHNLALHRRNLSVVTTFMFLGTEIRLYIFGKPKVVVSKENDVARACLISGDEPSKFNRLRQNVLAANSR